ncbi:MAG: rhomboid family intramembrane serine protease [Candidatus Neomarinimicrobiota bacterium]|nr:MAG: rhomboid family intramembrane serine protease [Candidatus Neomarinimicrobiota bacterium]
MRYQFQSEYGQHPWRPTVFTEAIKILIGTNLALFGLKLLASSRVDLVALFGLSPGTVWPLVWQPVTYMFMHGNLWHVLINMLVLWMFGSELELLWGRKEFLRYYFLTGVGSGLIWLLFNLGNPHTILIGASGAVYGILLAYGLLFPNRTVYLYFVIPIKVKWLVLFLGVAAFFSSFNSYSHISNLTHLSGMVIGFFYLKKDLRWRRISFHLRKRAIDLKTRLEERKQVRTWETQQEIDRILDRINQVGIDGLSQEEMETLERASRKMSRGQKKD